MLPTRPFSNNSKFIPLKKRSLMGPASETLKLNLESGGNVATTQQLEQSIMDTSTGTKVMTNMRISALKNVTLVFFFEPLYHHQFESYGLGYDKSVITHALLCRKTHISINILLQLEVDVRTKYLLCIPRINAIIECSPAFGL